MSRGFEAVRRLCSEAVSAGVVPGAVVLVSADGQTVFHEAFGLRQLLPLPLDATADTIYDVASLTKAVVTSVLAMQAVGSGTLRLDDAVVTHLPEFTGDDVPTAALVISEPVVLFDPMEPKTTATKTSDGYRLNGIKSGVVRGAECEVFIVGAELDGDPRLFIVESKAKGVGIAPDPSMGLRAAGLSRLSLDGVTVGDDAIVGTADDYRDCIRLSRIAWAGLALGTSKAVLDYTSEYVKTRQAFGEPIAHRQAVAFKVADIAIELEGMRLVTLRAASRAELGKDFAREAALARKLTAEYGMRIGTDGVQLLGGHGYVKEHPVERWYRDLRAIGIMEGAVLV
jgi:alkylation response protein AidB-like acyl-CoA dehydrogenase